MIAEILHGDSAEILRTWPANSVDAIVTDPPYGLSKQPNTREVLTRWLAGDDYEAKGGGFMGKSWDSFVPGPALWSECLRVLKPGGHVLAFYGSRTYDLGVTAMRLAGFEVRDSLQWLYGTGFPKHAWVPDLIDKAKPKDPRVKQVTAWIAGARDAAGRTNADIDREFGCNGMAAHWTSQKTQPHVPNGERFAELCEYLSAAPPAEITTLVTEINTGKGKPGEAWADRPITGQHEKVSPGAELRSRALDKDLADTPGVIRTAVRPEALAWEGWGTALKPAHEPIVLARKPLAGTIAATVQAHGTGAMNIRGCRIEAPDKAEYAAKGASVVGCDGTRGYSGDRRPRRPRRPRTDTTNPLGRHPANVILDPEAGAMIGEGARFFYCPKTSTKEREAGCEHLRQASAGELTGGRAEGSAGLDNPRAGAGRKAAKRGNKHPTVKPIALMRWLVRLITPPDGIVLDPFAGSGSTGIAAVLEGFDFAGIDMSEEYCEIARARLAHWREQEAAA